MFRLNTKPTQANKNDLEGLSRVKKNAARNTNRGILERRSMTLPQQAVPWVGLHTNIRAKGSTRITTQYKDKSGISPILRRYECPLRSASKKRAAPLESEEVPDTVSSSQDRTSNFESL